MKSIGDYLKEARIRKKYSKARVEAETKIKKGFVDAIEREDWILLPELPVVIGFVKSIAQVLDLEPNQIVALLKRDYPPRKINPNPKPDIKSKFVWNPKLTFVSIIVFVLLALFSYLSYQYWNFTKPPFLQITTPSEGQEVKTKELTVSGKTNPEAVIKVNNQPVLVSDDGNFVTVINIYEGTNEVEIKAVTRSGIETVVKRKIKPELGN